MTARTIRRANPYAREDRRLDAMRLQVVFKTKTITRELCGMKLSRRHHRYQLHTLQPRTGRA